MIPVSWWYQVSRPIASLTAIEARPGVTLSAWHFCDVSGCFAATSRWHVEPGGDMLETWTCLDGMLIKSHEDTPIHHMIFGKQNESLPAAQNGCSMFSRSFLKHDMGWQDSYLVSFMDFKSQDCREKPQWKATVAFEEQAMERYLHKSYKSAVGSVIPRIPVSKTRM